MENLRPKPESVEININSEVLVRLTPYGKIVVTRYLIDLWGNTESTNQVIEKKLTEDESGYTGFAFEELARIFSPYLFVGGKPVFQEDRVIIPFKPSS